jgi:hypothetical protein
MKKKPFSNSFSSSWSYDVMGDQAEELPEIRDKLPQFSGAC